MSLRAEAGQTLREAPGGGGPWATGLGTPSPARFEDEAGAGGELGDEPILQRGPQPLDAALGLGRAGGDVADAEVLQDAAEVGRPLRAGELFLERPVGVVADEEVEAVAVEGERQAVLGEEL